MRQSNGPVAAGRADSTAASGYVARQALSLGMILQDEAAKQGTAVGAFDVVLASEPITE